MSAMLGIAKYPVHAALRELRAIKLFFLDTVLTHVDENCRRP